MDAKKIVASIASGAFNFSLIKKTLNVLPPQADDRQESRLEVYRTKALTLKQIMARKARFYRRINDAQNILTVVVTSLLLFMGFSGLPKIQEYISLIYPASPIGAELSFNVSLFLLFVIGVLHLVFRFPEKQSTSEKGIASLAALANEIDDTITSRGNLVISEDSAKVSLTRIRYEAIAENLPANSEREYIRAKNDIAKKSTKKPSQVSGTRDSNNVESERENYSDNNTT